MRLLIT